MTDAQASSAPRRGRPPLRGSNEGTDIPLRVRKHKHGAGNDALYIDTSKFPDGWTYEWKRRTVYGEENPAYNMSLAENGWEHVKASDHPELQTKPGAIERGGLCLMRRPDYLTEEAREEDRYVAENQVKRQAASMGYDLGNERGTNHPSAKRVSHTRTEYVPISVNEIPDE